MLNKHFNLLYQLFKSFHQGPTSYVQKKKTLSFMKNKRKYAT